MAELYPMADVFVLPGGYGSRYPEGMTRGERVSGELFSEAGTLSNLTVRGQLSLLRSGALAAGQDGYDSGTGFFMDYNDGTPRLSIGNSNGNKLTWNGSALDITGALTATTGSIGGFTVGSSTITGGNFELNSAGSFVLGSGNNSVRASASGSYALWAGNANGALAPFSVTPAGTVNAGTMNVSNINVTGGTVAGSTVGSGIAGGNITAGSITGTQIAAGTITANKLSVSTLSAITANLGTITAGSITGGTISANTITTGSLTFGSSGQLNSTGSYSGTLGGLSLANLTVTGTITLGSGGKIVDADGSEWNQNGIILKSSGSFGDTLKWQVSGVDRGAIYADSGGIILAYSASGAFAWLTSGGNAVLGSDDSYRLEVNHGVGIQTGGPIYPGSTGSRQTSRSISDANSRLTLTGQVELASASVGGSAANWSSGSPTGAAYVVVYINGVACRIPFWANG